MIIQICSREQNKKPITDYFDKVGQKWFVSKCYAGDYKDSESNKILIELKHSHNDGLAELCSNLTNTINHNRFRNEVLRAKEIGCEHFYILIATKDIASVDDVHNWENKYGKVSPITFEKIMKTFAEKYGVEYIFSSRKDLGKNIISLLTKK